MIDVFISYSRQDVELVSRLAATLEASGYSVWWDVSGLHGGQAFASEIQNALKAAKCAIVVWSKASVTSNWVHSEATQADSQGILLPVVYQDAQIPLPFNNRHNESLRDWRGDLDAPDFQKLLNAIAQYCPASADEYESDTPLVIPAAMPKLQEVAAVAAKETVVLGSAISGRAGVGASVVLVVAVGAYVAFPLFNVGNEASLAPQPAATPLLADADQSSPAPTPLAAAENQGEAVAFEWFEPKMIDIPGGTFLMGCVDGQDEAHGVCDKSEKPVHEVTVADFSMAETEVTVGQFRAFVEATKYKTTAEKDGSCWVDKYKTGRWKSVNPYFWDAPGVDFAQSENHPVVCVTLEDTKQYLDWLNTQTHKNYRLPSEAQWEYAARGGNGRQAYPWGQDGKEGCNHANMADQTAKGTYGYLSGAAGCRDGYVHTASAGSFKPNGFELYDMHGNVAEWVQDRMHADYNSAPVDGGVWEGSSGHRVIRGGSWHSTPWYARSAFRGQGVHEEHRYVTLGFRPVLDR